MTEPIDRAEIRGRHVPRESLEHSTLQWCNDDLHELPCDAIRLLDALEKAEVRADAAERAVLDAATRERSVRIEAEGYRQIAQEMQARAEAAEQREAALLRHVTGLNTSPNVALTFTNDPFHQRPKGEPSDG